VDWKRRITKTSIKMKKVLTILSVAIMVLATSCKDESQGEIKLVTPEEMQTLLEQKDVQLVDVRTPKELEDGFIDNAQNIDFNSPTFDEDILKLDKSKPVVLYCKSGGRSAKCAEKLKAAGFIKVFDLDGGITKWKFKGFKIQTEN